MTWITEKTAIEGRFTGWTASRIQLPNTTFAEPTNAVWIAPHILDGDGQLVTLGVTPTLRRHTGVVSVQVFAPENQGETSLRTIADQVEALFIGANSRLTLSATEWIDFGQPSLSGPQVVNGYYQRNVIVPFQRSESK